MNVTNLDLFYLFFLCTVSMTTLVTKNIIRISFDSVVFLDSNPLRVTFLKTTDFVPPTDVTNYNAMRPRVAGGGAVDSGALQATYQQVKNEFIRNQTNTTRDVVPMYGFLNFISVR